MTVILQSLPVTGSSHISLRPMQAEDFDAIEQLLDLCFGAERLQKTAQLLRDGNQSIAPLDLVAIDQDGQVCGSIRYWPIEVARISGGTDIMLWLGPLAVHPDQAGNGIGAALMRASMQIARNMGFAHILLVGDEAWYQRFGFSADATGALDLPGAYDPARLLMAQLDGEVVEDGNGWYGMIRQPWQPNAQAAE